MKMTVSGAELAAPDGLIGRSFGPYRLARQIIGGEAAAVYLAEVEATGQPAVVMLVPDRPPEGERTIAAVRRRIQRITALAAQCPIVAAPVESPAVGEGMLLVATELPPGELLRDLVSRDGPLPEARALRLAILVGEALESAHNVGLLHGGLTADTVHV